MSYKDPKQIEIKELDIDSIRPNYESMKTTSGGAKIAIIGKSGSGKSVLIKHLLFAKKHLFRVGMAISGSEDSNRFYSKIFPELFIYNSLRNDIVENFINRQKVAMKYLSDAWAVLVMDDCMDDVKKFNDPLWVGLAKNSRHWNMFSIFASQYVFDFNPAIRTNIDGVFIFREPNHENREKIWKNFASIIPKNLFGKIMDELTSDFTCIYINNREQSNVWTDCVFYFKAQQVPDFQFGSEDYINFAKTRQIEDDD
jgi:hypothetical protein